ncbi:MAG: ATP-binding protein [Ilumatobacteraceae bacterium]
MDALSAREAEVLALVGAQLTNPEIAGRLFISVRTVESHVSALLRKLSLADRRALVAYAGRQGGVAAPVIRGAPRSITSFIGRQRDLDRVASAISSAPLVTLTGPGGVGKTRLAVEVATRAPAESAWFVDLVPVSGDLVPNAVARALGVSDLPGQSLVDVICDELNRRSGRLVLDNCEHVVLAVADLVRRVLERCAGISILATSREALRIPGERVVAVGALDLDGHDAGAPRLFRARATDAGVVLGATDDDTVVEICRRLDGMPLAIELAAVRCTGLGVDGVLAGLRDGQRMLDSSAPDGGRHGSLRAVLDWSHALLDDTERGVFRRLCVFGGEFRLSDAVALCEEAFDAAQTTDAVGRLAEKSLLTRARDSAPTLYRMLETIRAYASWRQVEAGEADVAGHDHVRWALREANRLCLALFDQGSVPDDVTREFDDLRGACAWAAVHSPRPSARSLSRCLGQLAYAQCFHNEAREYFEQAAELASTDGEAATDLLDAGHCAFALMRGEIGYQRFVAAAERASTAGDADTATIAFSLAVERANRMQAEFAVVPERATLGKLLERAIHAGRDAGALGRAHLALADAWMSTERLKSANRSSARRAVDEARAVGDAVLESGALDALAAAAWDEGELTESAAICMGRTALLDRLGLFDLRAGAEHLDILHMAADGPFAQGDLPHSLSFARRAIEHPMARGIAHMLQHDLVVGLCLSGRFDEAIDRGDVMRAGWHSSGRPSAGWMAPAVHLIAMVHGLRGDATRHDDWIALSEHVTFDPRHAARAFASMRLALHQGRLDDAAGEIERRESTTGSRAGFPWSASGIGYEGYMWSVAAEVAAARRAPDAAGVIERIRTASAQHAWARPVLLRAEARLRGDVELLRQAAQGFAEIDAMFEHAVTLEMLPGPEGEAGRIALAALGCQPAARVGVV